VADIRGEYSRFDTATRLYIQANRWRFGSAVAKGKMTPIKDALGFFVFPGFNFDLLFMFSIT
jgi:hypothetical protein